MRTEKLELPLPVVPVIYTVEWSGHTSLQMTGDAISESSALQARGRSVREIRVFLLHAYGTEVSPRASSARGRMRAGGGHGVAEPAAGDGLPVVFLDALRVKIREDGVVCTISGIDQGILSSTFIFLWR